MQSKMTLQRKIDSKPVDSRGCRTDCM